MEIDQLKINLGSAEQSIQEAKRSKEALELKINEQKKSIQDLEDLKSSFE